METRDQIRLGAFLLLIGAIEFLVAMFVSQSLYPGYSMSTNYISDLGASVYSAWIFDPAAVLLGMFIVVGAVAIWPALPKGGFASAGVVSFAIAGVGIAGVGTFEEHLVIGGIVPHYYFAVAAFLFGALALILIGWALKNGKKHLGWSVFSIILGVISLGALVAATLGTDLGLGPGGLERVIAFPPLIWALVVGFALLVDPKSFN